LNGLPDINALKDWTSLSDKMSQIVCSGKPFQPSLLFVSKAGAYLNRAPLSYSSLGRASGPF
jgi:hypothetical protein